MVKELKMRRKKKMRERRRKGYTYIYTYIVKSGQSPLQEVIAHYFLTFSKTCLVLYVSKCTYKGFNALPIVPDDRSGDGKLFIPVFRFKKK